MEHTRFLPPPYYVKLTGPNLLVSKTRVKVVFRLDFNFFSFFSSPGTNVLGEVLSYPRRRRRRRRRRCRCRRRQFQVKVFVY